MPRSSLDAIMSSVTASGRRTNDFFQKDLNVEQCNSRLWSIIKEADVRLVILSGMGDWKRDEVLEALKSQHGKEMFVISADNFMMQDDKYVFDPSKLTSSHRRCQGEARNALHSSNKTVVFIANKNSVIDHIKMYADWGYPFLSVLFKPSDSSNAVALGTGNRKHIPVSVYEQCYEEVVRLKLTQDIFPKLKGVCTILV